MPRLAGILGKKGKYHDTNFVFALGTKSSSAAIFTVGNTRTFRGHELQNLQYLGIKESSKIQMWFGENKPDKD